MLPLQNLRSEGDNFSKVFVAQFTRYRTKNAGTSWVAIVVDQNSCVIIKPNTHTTIPTQTFTSSDDNRAYYVRLFNSHIGNRIFNNRNDDVTNAAITAITTTNHADTHQLPGTAVICNIQVRLLLNHGFLRLCLSRCSKNVGHDPALCSAKRSRLLNADAIAHLTLVIFVVRLIALGARHNLAVLWVG